MCCTVTCNFYFPQASFSLEEQLVVLCCLSGMITLSANVDCKLNKKHIIEKLRHLKAYYIYTCIFDLKLKVTLLPKKCNKWCDQKVVCLMLSIASYLFQKPMAPVWCFLDPCHGTSGSPALIEGLMVLVKGHIATHEFTFAYLYLPIAGQG